MVTGPGGERRSEMRVCNLLARLRRTGGTAPGTLGEARAALRGLAALGGRALADVLTELPAGQAAMVEAALELGAARLGAGPALAGARLDAFLRRMAAMDPRAAGALWLRAAGFGWEVAETLTGLLRDRLRRLIRQGAKKCAL